VRNPGIDVLGWAGVALAQQAALHVAGLGQRGDQWRVDPRADMAVVGRSALVAEHLYRQAVVVQRQVLSAFTAVQRGQPSDRLPQKAFMQGINVVAPAQADQQRDSVA
jgi:hypothetical protein